MDGYREYKEKKRTVFLPDWRSGCGTVRANILVGQMAITSSAILGHAAMALSNTEIVNIAGEGSVAQVLTRSQFDNLLQNCLSGLLLRGR